MGNHIYKTVGPQKLMMSVEYYQLYSEKNTSYTNNNNFHTKWLFLFLSIFQIFAADILHHANLNGMCS